MVNLNNVLNRLKFSALYLFMTVSLLLGACGSSNSLTTATSSEPSERFIPAMSRSAGLVDVRTFNRLKKAYTEWRGTPYQLGGTTLKGIDCSAFMQVVFDEYLGETLPRTTLEQMKVGKKVRHKRVDLGDLVFFKTGPTTYHVGVMVDWRHFLHAGTTGGVMISDLNARYWSVRYLSARRVL